MLSTWIEAAAKGRLGGPVRAGMWSSVVLGTNPIQPNQEVWLEISVDEVPIGPLPAYWIENRGVNSLWHVPIPPQAVGGRLHYRSAARRDGTETAYSNYQDTIIRPNLPDQAEGSEIAPLGPEGLVGNRMLTARVDGRGSTFDIYYPTAGLHSNVRPGAGDQPQSRCHFRGIVGGLALGRRLDWFTERSAWEAFQHYLGATNLLTTELTWRDGPVRVLVTDFAVMRESLPQTAGGTESPGQYLKRFRIKNEGDEPLRALFGVYIQAEVNGGIGEPALSWLDGDRTLLAANRGHAHVNRKLARDATVEFAIALDGRGEVHCEPTGPNEAILLRWLEIPAADSVTVDLLVSGAFTGWRGDPGTYEHWLEPALAWFRSADLDQVEQATALQWDAFVEPLPSAHYPKPTYAVSLRRSALAMALHTDETWGAVVSGFERGLSAYCWPREAIAVGATLDRMGHTDVGRTVYRWLSKVRSQNRTHSYWFQKYTIDGFPEWETPAVDQTAMIPWGLERHYRRTGDLELVTQSWPMIEQAANVCMGVSGHPGLCWRDDLKLVCSAGIWGTRFGAFLYSNAAVVAGLRAAARLARILDRVPLAEKWEAFADTVWESGILAESRPGHPDRPGMVDAETGRFLDSRRMSTLRGLWTSNPDFLIDRASTLDISLLGLVEPFGLLPASDTRVLRSAELILRTGTVNGDPNALSRWTQEPGRPSRSLAPIEAHLQDVSSLATLWMARYLMRLGRETGQGRHWNRALSMLEGILGRLLPLGLSLRTAARASDPAARSTSTTSSGVWALHSSLVDTLLDLAALDYDAVDRLLALDPILPGSWPHTGLTQHFPCGEASYRLERPIGGTVHQLTVKTNLRHPATLQVGVTCPGLTELGPWTAAPTSPEPAFDAKTGRLAWRVDLPKGETTRSWTWG